MLKNDANYFRRREREELRLADATSGTNAEAIHRELAERYAQALASANLPGSTEVATAGDAQASANGDLEIAGSRACEPVERVGDGDADVIREHRAIGSPPERGAKVYRP